MRSRYTRMASAAGFACLVVIGGTSPGESLADGGDELNTQLSAGGATMTAAEISEAANQVLMLHASAVVALAVDATPGAAVRLTVPIAGRERTLDLTPHSIRSPNYQVFEQHADGSYVAIEPEPERTLRGTVDGAPNSKVAASLLDEGLYARIALSDDVVYWIEPLGPHVAGAGASAHVVYNAADAMGCGQSCATQAEQSPFHVDGPFSAGEFIPCDNGICVAELACDSDFEYYQDHGSNTAAVQNQIFLIINAVNMQYERDVIIKHEITATIVRTAEPDPYGTTNFSALLSSVRSQWLPPNHPTVPRDVVHLFTGKDLTDNGGPSNVIGVAWGLNLICTTSGVCLAQSDFNNNFSCKTDLTAHELGHLWGAGHCNCVSGPDRSTMNASITCTNVFHPTQTIPSIDAHRNSRQMLGCLDIEGGTVCGDGVVDENEECDPPNVLHCDLTCHWICGDGVVQSGEECDPPNGVSCDDQCMFLPCFGATGDCCAPTGAPGCGDPQCCAVVCAVDVNCCDGNWDAGCAFFATQAPICGCPQCSTGDDCPNQTVCTTPECQGGMCVYQANTEPCDDGDSCTINDRCAQLECVGTPAPCDDGDPCTINDHCSQSECTGSPAPCNDGMFCNGVEFCSNGQCLGTTAPCFGDPCNEDDDSCCTGVASPPFIVHADGLLGETRPCTGYIDPRIESSNGSSLDRGVQEFVIAFNEPVFGPGMTAVGPGDFLIRQTGGGVKPIILTVEPLGGDGRVYRVLLDRVIKVGAWTTIQALVVDICGDPITNAGEMGPGIPEPDRIDVAHLPGDVSQNGSAQPSDLIFFRQFLALGAFTHCGLLGDYFDIDRNGSPGEPADLIRFRQILAGTSPATRAWLGQSLNQTQP
ncbi:MAG: hypothetical protein HOP29_05755 [Phycisphaerales bacterium]|nr:hypothetical protein [Phycisphaerales bacterium]